MIREFSNKSFSSLEELKSFERNFVFPEKEFSFESLKELEIKNNYFNKKDCCSGPDDFCDFCPCRDDCF